MAGSRLIAGYGRLVPFSAQIHHSLLRMQAFLPEKFEYFAHDGKFQTHVWIRNE